MKIIFMFQVMTDMVHDEKIKDFSIFRASLEQVYAKIISEAYQNEQLSWK